MILSGKEIEKHMGKEIVIEPYDPKRLIPTAITCPSITSCWSMKTGSLI